MATGLHELVWAAVLLDGCPNVDVLGVRVDATSERIAGEYVPLLVLDVHAGSQDDAAALADSLALREVEGRVTESDLFGPKQWRNWCGWVPDGSREAPVWVEVTGCDLVHGMAVA
jgi:hypothetical protein